MPEWITQYWVEWLFGIIAAVLAYGWKSLSGRVDAEKKKNDAVRLGVQALLRAQMITDWNHYSEKGYAPIYAKESFENCWKQYENLGANGVMQNIRKKFMELPEREVTK